MSDPRSTKQSEPESPIERPTWRFSGRRGTPVHLREQAPATLPREIQQAIVQMARERTPETPAATADTPSKAAGRAVDVQLADAHAARTEGQSPPVAGAAVPRERRASRAPAPDAVTTSPIAGTATEPTAATEEPAVTAESAVTAEPAVDAERTEPSAASSGTAQIADTVRESDATTDSQIETTPLVEADADAAKPVIPAGKKKSRSKAKARAKARAKAKAKAKASDKPSKRSTGERRLLAQDREVPLDEAAAIEPAPPKQEPTPAPSPAPTPAAPVEPAAVDELPDDPFAPAATWEPAASPTAPIPPHDPVAGSEAARQAAWELGRLPILLEQTTGPSHDAPEADPERELEPAALEPSSTPETPAAATPPRATPREDESRGWKPRVTRPIRERQPQVQQPAELQPIDWLPLGPDPRPAPIEAPSAIRETPAAIRRLTDGLDARQTIAANHVTRARGGDDHEHAPAARAAESRHRLARRRRQLDEVVASLASISSANDPSDDA